MEFPIRNLIRVRELNLHAEPLNLTDIPRLRSETAKISEGRISKLVFSVTAFLMDVDPSDVSINIDPIKISIPKKIWRVITQPFRVKRAAIAFIHRSVGDDKDGKQNLIEARDLNGLDHLDIDVVAKQLIVACRKIQPEYPKLSEWIANRIALLEIFVETPYQVRDSQKERELLARTLTFELAIANGGGISDEKLNQAIDKLLRESLDDSARAALEAMNLDPKEIRYSANLMWALESEDAFSSWLNSAAVLSKSKDVINRSTIANNLWKTDFPKVNRRLVVISEFNGDNHEGFWVPADPPSSSHRTLPGAPSACQLKRGTSIYVSHLPSLIEFGYSESLHTQWSTYLTDNFSKEMFFSIPFLLPKDSKDWECPLVLNVNADLTNASREDFMKPMLKEWLKRGEEASRNSLETAFYALYFTNSLNKMI